MTRALAIDLQTRAIDFDNPRHQLVDHAYLDAGLVLGRLDSRTIRAL